MTHLRPLHAIACLALLGTAAGIRGAQAAAPAPAAAPTLQQVMQGLERDMQAVTGAIARDDWQQVVHLAPLIASHAEPAPAEKAGILTWLGANAPKFRAFDMQAHTAAEAMGEAAARGDGNDVIAAFARVQQACLGCHQAYRQGFIRHFRGDN